MTAHVFIVNDDTFPVHLQYCFAGTGATNIARVDFNSSGKSKLHHSRENLIVKMIADVERIRQGDRVLFYAQSAGGQEGRFYGIFKATGSAFLDNKGQRDQYLINDLGKSLTFRVLFKPDEVYPKGVTEWSALDEIRELEKPHQMVWSLIYRKLKGNRGCTMITPSEEKRLCDLIRKEQEPLDCHNRLLSFDPENREITALAGKQKLYKGTREPFAVMPRLLAKHDKGNQFEAHLQAWLVAQLARQKDEVANILLKGRSLEWLGNEIGCGVGMQSIDIMVSCRGGQKIFVLPIELKSVSAHADNIRQIQRYIDWIEQYYIPNHQSIIEPVLIARQCPGDLPADFVEHAREFNLRNAGETCGNLRLIEFEVVSNGLRFKERSIF